MPPRKQDTLIDKIKRNSWSEVWKELRLGESYASLLLGLVVVIIVVVLAITFVRSRSGVPTSQPEVSSDKTEKVTEAKSKESYVVAEGETLWSIAEKKYNSGYRWVDIAKENNLNNPDIVETGTKLTLPAIKEDAVREKQPTEETATPTLPPQVQQKEPEQQGAKITGTTYTVTTGDFLWEIAVRAYGDGYKWVDIARVNNLENPDLIFPENVLKLPR